MAALPFASYLLELKLFIFFNLLGFFFKKLLKPPVHFVRASLVKSSLKTSFTWVLLNGKSLQLAPSEQREATSVSSAGSSRTAGHTQWPDTSTSACEIVHQPHQLFKFKYLYLIVVVQTMYLINGEYTLYSNVYGPY